jgi:adenylylsulfate kinase
MKTSVPLTPRDSLSVHPDEQDRPGHLQGFTLWFTGLSGSGKSTITQKLAPRLRKRNRSVEILDGDEVRENLSKGLGFSREDRDINIRRIGWVCSLLNRHGAVAISAAISPFRDARKHTRDQIRNFIEIHVDCPLEVLKERDPKGLYDKAIRGEIKNFTGVSDPYEPPENPEIVLHTDTQDLDTCVQLILDYLEAHGWILPPPLRRVKIHE